MTSAMPRRDLRPAVTYERIPVAAGALAVLVGILVLVGWWRGIEALRTIVPGLIPTIPNTAVAFIVGGASLLCAIRSDRDARLRALSRVFAIALTLMGLAFFLERVTGIDLGIDLLLFGDRVQVLEWVPPGRPAVNSAIVMMLNGAALLLIDERTHRGGRPSVALGTAALAISVIAIVGYLYGVRGFYSFGPFTGMALLTAIAFTALNIGVLFLREDAGLVSFIFGGDAGAVMVRRLLPAALIVPIGLGALWLWVQDTGLLGREMGVSAFVVAIVATFILLIMRAASVVRWADAEREDLLVRAQAARAEAERAADRTGRLQRMAEALSGAITPAEVARVIVEEGPPALDASATELAVLSAAAGTVLELMGSKGLPDDVAVAWREFPVTSPVPLADAVRTGAPVLLGSPAEIRQRYPHFAPVLERMEIGAVLAAPMLVDGRPSGALSFSFRTPRAFGEADVTFVRTLAQQSAQALERARLYTAEQAARAEAEAASRAKTDFLAMMSHELRTPLNAIAGYAELMELGISGPVTELQQEQLSRIRRSQRHLLGIIEDLLDLSRLERGTPADIEFAPVPINETLGGLEALIAPQLEAKNLTYIYNPCDRAIVAYGSRARIEQIVLNLLSNAVKYTPPGGRVGLSSDLRGGMVEIRVSDTGHGVPRDKLDSIFEPFTRVDMDLTRTTEGTGLGLAISRQLARAMRGDLTARSDLGRGSIFTLTLSAEQPAAPMTPAATLGAPVAMTADGVPLPRVRM